MTPPDPAGAPARVDPRDALERARARAAEHRGAARRLTLAAGRRRGRAASDRLARAEDHRAHASELAAVARALAFALGAVGADDGGAS
jgi:hypothetical protein